MTTKEEQKHTDFLSTDIERAEQILSELCHGNHRWTMRVPVNEDDSDQVLARLIRHAKSTRKADFHEELVGKVGTLFDAIKHGDSEHQEWLRNKINEHFGIAK